MITPGTKFVTVGGCIANDVHGKAHHAQGCFSACVDDMTVLLASGEVVRASRDENADLFWGDASAAWVCWASCCGHHPPAPDRDRRTSASGRSRSTTSTAMLAALDENDRTFPYSVATLDVFADGRAPRAAASSPWAITRAGTSCRASSAPHPLRVSGPPRLTVPFELPELVLNRAQHPRGQRGHPAHAGERRRRSVTTRGSSIRST